MQPPTCFFSVAPPTKEDRGAKDYMVALLPSMNFEVQEDFGLDRDSTKASKFSLDEALSVGVLKAKATTATIVSRSCASLDPNATQLLAATIVSRQWHNITNQLQLQRSATIDDDLLNDGCFGVQAPDDDAAVERELRGPTTGYSGKCSGDLTGQVLNDPLVVEARAKKLAFFF